MWSALAPREVDDVLCAAPVCVFVCCTSSHRHSRATERRGGGGDWKTASDQHGAWTGRFIRSILTFCEAPPSIRPRALAAAMMFIGPNGQPMMRVMVGGPNGPVNQPIPMMPLYTNPCPPSPCGPPGPVTMEEWYALGRAGPLWRRWQQPLWRRWQQQHPD